jgi:hypothetical protein
MIEIFFLVDRVAAGHKNRAEISPSAGGAVRGLGFSYIEGLFA